MNGPLLIDGIAKDAKITKTAADKALRAFTAAIMRALKKGDKVTLAGFGTFSVIKRRARKGRDPRTGREINIPAAKVAKFKPGSKLRASVK